MKNYIEDKDSHEARIDNQEETILEGYKTKLKWYEKNYGPYIGERGLKNWKNLFRKPTMRDLMILVILVCVLFSAWAYKIDVQTCQDAMESLPRDVCEACSEFRSMAMNESLNEANFNLSNLKFVNIS